MTNPTCFGRYRSPQSDAESCCDECRVEASCMATWLTAISARRAAILRQRRDCPACGDAQVQALIAGLDDTPLWRCRMCAHEWTQEVTP